MKTPKYPTLPTGYNMSPPPSHMPRDISPNFFPLDHIQFLQYVTFLGDNFFTIFLSKCPIRGYPQIQLRIFILLLTLNLILILIFSNPIYYLLYFQFYNLL